VNLTPAAEARKGRKCTSRVTKTSDEPVRGYLIFFMIVFAVRITTPRGETRTT
jgi:hypothetical protein